MLGAGRAGRCWPRPTAAWPARSPSTRPAVIVCVPPVHRRSGGAGPGPGRARGAGDHRRSPTWSPRTGPGATQPWTGSWCPPRRSASVAREDGMPEGRYCRNGASGRGRILPPPPAAAERSALQRALGLRGRRFLVVMTGGAEGSGGLYRRAAAILRQLPEVDVAVICGRNRRLRRRLDRLAARAGRPADRAGVRRTTWPTGCAAPTSWSARRGRAPSPRPTCCAAPLVLTSFVPGQEQGNAGFVTSAGRRPLRARAP